MEVTVDHASRPDRPRAWRPGRQQKLWQSAGGEWRGDKVEPVVADFGGDGVVDRTATVKYQIVNANSGRCLTVPGNPVSRVDGAQLLQWDCTNGAAAQLFTVTRVGPAAMWLHMTSTSGKCIDLNGSGTAGRRPRSAARAA